jgi:hypothetical protein
MGKTVLLGTQHRTKARIIFGAAWVKNRFTLMYFSAADAAGSTGLRP